MQIPRERLASSIPIAFGLTDFVPLSFFTFSSYTHIPLVVSLVCPSVLPSPYLYWSVYSLLLKSCSSVVHKSLAVAKKEKLLVSVTVPPAPVRVPSQWTLDPNFSSVTSVANDKGDN